MSPCCSGLGKLSTASKMAERLGNMSQGWATCPKVPSGHPCMARGGGVDVSSHEA